MKNQDHPAAVAGSNFSQGFNLVSAGGRKKTTGFGVPTAPW